MDGAFTEITISDVPVDNSVVEQGHVLKDWFIFRDERHFGPLSSKEVRRFLSKKMISSNHHIWRPGFTGWKAIKDIEAFRSHGKAVIRDMNDDDFSFKAGLNQIDRISLEAGELDFVERERKKQEEEEELSFFMTAIKSIGEVTGFSNESRSSSRLIFTSFLFTALIGFIIFFNRSQKYEFLNELPTEIKEKLIQVSKLKETNKNPEFIIFEKEYNASDPILISSTNLPVGSRIQISITGDEATLLGTYRFKKTEEVRLKSKIFMTDSIREESGKYIAPGSYTITVDCLSCGTKDKEIYKSSFLFGIKDQMLYQRELKRFHLETRQAAQLELSELKDLGRTLEQQYQVSVNQFVSSSSKRNTREWNKFSTVWLANQKKFIDLFEQMNSDKFMKELYYLEFYAAYDHLILQIFELHLLQDGIVMSSSENVAESSQNLSKLSQEISLSLATLESQLNLMEINFSKSNGLPLKEGLKLTNL